MEPDLRSFGGYLKEKKKERKKKEKGKRKRKEKKWKILLIDKIRKDKENSFKQVVNDKKFKQWMWFDNNPLELILLLFNVYCRTCVGFVDLECVATSEDLKIIHSILKGEQSFALFKVFMEYLLRKVHFLDVDIRLIHNAIAGGDREVLEFMEENELLKKVPLGDKHLFVVDMDYAMILYYPRLFDDRFEPVVVKASDHTHFRTLSGDALTKHTEYLIKNHLNLFRSSFFYKTHCDRKLGWVDS